MSNAILDFRSEIFVIFALFAVKTVSRSRNALVRLS